MAGDCSFACMSWIDVRRDGAKIEASLRFSHLSLHMRAHGAAIRSGQAKLMMLYLYDLTKSESKGLFMR